MSKQRIEDFLTKQLFISKNIVTYRLLSRECGIHVNAAKNELAAFYTMSNKPPDQACSATYLISGEYTSPSSCSSNDAGTESKKANGGLSMDMDMDMDLDPSPYDITSTQSQSQSHPQLQVKDIGPVEGSREDNGDVVVQTRLTVVGEAGLEDAKAKYTKLNSVTLYSLSPAPIRDADLLCEPSRRIREVDNQKGVGLAKAVGRIIGEGIEMKAGITKPKGRLTAATTTSAKSTLAAPKLKTGPSASTSAAVTTASMKVEERGKEPVKDEPKLKLKQTGKVNFFAPKPQAQTKERETKGSAESKGKMFFGTASGPSSRLTVASSAKEQAPVPVPAPPPPPKEEKSKEVEPVKRGTKRKSNIAIPSDEEESAKSTSAAPSRAPSRQSSNPPSTRSSPQPISAMSNLRLQKNAIVSDGEEEEELPRKKVVKKPRRKVTHISDDEDEYNSEAAKESTRALKSMMDIGDDQVEKASRKPKVEPLRREEEEETEPEQEAPKVVDQDGDVNMLDDAEAKPKPKPRKKKEKKAVPVGRNGLKKRRVTRSQVRVDEKGYTVTEDYSSYESVEEEEEEEPKKTVSTKKGSGGKRAAGVKKKEDSMTESAPPEDTAVSNPTTNSETRSKTTAKAAASLAKAATSKSTGTKGVQKQKTLNTFFGVPKPKK